MNLGMVSRDTNLLRYARTIADFLLFATQGQDKESKHGLKEGRTGCTIKVALDIRAGRMDLEHCVGSHGHSEAHGDAV